MTTNPNPSIDRQAQEYACEHIASFGRGGYLREEFGDHLAAFAHRLAATPQPAQPAESAAVAFLRRWRSGEQMTVTEVDAIIEGYPQPAQPQGDDLRNVISEKRRKLGWSLRDLEAETGISFSTLARFERGERVGNRVLAHIRNWAAVATPSAAIENLRPTRIDVDANREVALRNLEKSGLRATPQPAQPQGIQELIAYCRQRHHDFTSAEHGQRDTIYSRIAAALQTGESALRDAEGLSDDEWMALAAAFGPVLKEAFADHTAMERMAVADALAKEVRRRERWFLRGAALPANTDALRQALEGFVGDLTAGGRNRSTMLSIDHDALKRRIDQARAALATPSPVVEKDIK